MEFRILGPLEVRGDRGATVDLPRGRQRALLALLLLHADEVVSSDRLIEELWAGRPPETAANALQVYVGALRKVLEPRRTARASGQTLVTRPPGYLLALEGHELDARRFERLASGGRAVLADGASAEAAETLRSALGLWRGQALAEFVDEEWARQEILRLGEARLVTREDLFEAELALGHHRELLPELEALVLEEPLRERLRGQLMLALYRSGRQADALELYRMTRSLFIEELGIEPSPALQALEQALLRQEAALDLKLPSRAELPSRAPIRKPVTALVAELELTTSDGEPVDAEVGRPLLAPWLESGRAVIERHGGTSEVLPDGSLLGLFGAERVHEDDALRAARAAEDLRRSSATPERTPLAVPVRVGIESAEVVFRADERQLQQRLGGTLVREASRRRLLAGPGEVMLGERTRALLAGNAELEPAAAGLWSLRSVAADAAAVPRRLDAPLVGREPELATLERELAAVEREQRCRLVTVLGEPGIGKSRLAGEFIARVRGRATTTVGHCPAYGEGVTYRPLAEIVRDLAGDTTWAAVEALLGETEEARTIAERLLTAIGEVEREATAEETAWATRRLLELLSAQRPTVIVLDDLHWGGETLLELIETLPAAAEGPILLVALARPELTELRVNWPPAALTLEPLADSEAATLLDRLLTETQLDPSLRDEIARAAEGNPLFLEQIVALLAERGGTVGIPATVQGLLAARLELLADDERDVASRLAVAGRELSPQAIAALTVPADTDGVELVAQLIRKQFLEGDQSGNVRFRHQLIRDACYQALPKTTRAALHARYGDWLEQAADSDAEAAEVIGYQLEQAALITRELEPTADAGATLAARAAPHLALAGRRAQARGDIPAAVDLLARATALIPEDSGDAAALFLSLADARRELGDFRGAGAALDGARAAARAAGSGEREAQAEILALRLRLQTEPDLELERLLATTDNVIAQLEELESEGALAEAWLVRAWITWTRCQATTTTHAVHAALEHAGRAGDQRAIGQARNLLIGAWLFGPTSVDEAITRCKQVLQEPDASGRIRASAYRALGGLAAMQGRFDEARAYLEQDAEIIDQLGLRVAAAVAAEIWGILELLAQRPVAAEHHLRAGIALLEPMGEKSGVSTLTALLAEAAYRQGRDDDVLALAEHSRRLAASDDYSTHVQWKTARAKALARAGELKLAEALASEAVELAASSDFLNLHGNALLCHAQMLRLGGRLAQAGHAAEHALSLYEQKGNVVSAQAARAFLAETVALT